jgi:spermidine/putrescine transport system permease protein
MSSETNTQTSADTGESTLTSAMRWAERNWLRAWTALVLLFLYTPIIVIVVFSFEKSAFSTLPWSGFTLQWYEALFASSQAMNAIYNSVYVALFVTFFGTLMGTLGAIALVRHSFRGKTLYRALVLAPMTIPGLLLGVALLMMFNYLEISRSLQTVMVGQLVFVTPFVLVTVSSRLRGFDPILEEAARDLGASRWTAYRRVTLPLLAPGIISGGLFAFTLSFDDFLIAFFTSGAQNTLPVYIFSQVQRSTSPVVNAISAIALVVSITIVAASRYLQD